MLNSKAKLAFLFNFSVLVVCNGVDIVDDEDVDDGDDGDDVSKNKNSSTFWTLDRQKLISRKLRPREATVVPPAILMLKEVIMAMVVIMVVFYS